MRRKDRPPPETPAEVDLPIPPIEAPNKKDLTPVLEEAILDTIRQGAYPHVAAQAAGVDLAYFDAWMEQGRLAEQAHKNGCHKYRKFRREVFTAQAQARASAEAAVFSKDPLSWLRSGPGKETTGQAGWSLPTKPNEKGPAVLVNLLQNPLINLILEKLTPFPEARAAAAEALFPPEHLPKQNKQATTQEVIDQKPDTNGVDAFNLDPNPL